MAYIDYSHRVLSTFRSGIECYRDELERTVSNGMRLLHIGCGHDLSGITRHYGDKCAVFGVDLDLDAIRHYPGEAWYADAGALPFQGNTFDVAFSEYVLEHLADPKAVFSEIARVLCSGGRFISVAPNFWSYKSLAAHATPHWFHQVAVKTLRRDTARQSEDVYPTLFKANTGRALKQLASECDLELESLAYADNGPTWFQRIPGLFELGRVYHTALRAKPLAGLRCNIVVTLRKPGDGMRSEFGVRCVQCGFAPMTETKQAFHCSECDYSYLKEGTVSRVLD